VNKSCKRINKRTLAKEKKCKKGKPYKIKEDLISAKVD
jgi:hypothetical protein